MPDCEVDGCQWKEEVWCEGCPLQAPKRLALLDEATHPLYRLSSDFIHRQKLGIPQDHPGILLERCIRVVDSERNRIQEKEVKKRTD